MLAPTNCRCCNSYFRKCLFYNKPKCGTDITMTRERCRAFLCDHWEPGSEVMISRNIEAMKSYRSRYLSLQATEPLKMEDSVRIDVENRICDERGPRPDSFLRPQLVAFHTMNEVYYAAFKESSIYLRFLNDLIHMSNKADELSQAVHVGTSASHRKCDANRSRSTKARVPPSSTHFQGRDLDNPNSLWERPLLQFRLGFVNEFGEYISEIEPLSTKKDTSHAWSASARAMRKRKKDEELAMGIARNIISEVNNNLNIVEF